MPPTLTDQVIDLRADLGKVRDELHEQGAELKAQIGEFREEFAGFRARVESLIDDVPKIRNEFNEFRASIKTYLVVAGWGIGILATLTTGMIYASVNLTWNASRLHADVAQHGKQIVDLTAFVAQNSKDIEKLTMALAQNSKDIDKLTSAIGKLEEKQATAITKLEEKQKPLESLPSLVKSMEETARNTERLATRLDDGLRPLMALAAVREWMVLITRQDRITIVPPNPVIPQLPADAPTRTICFKVNLPGSLNPPPIGTLLKPTPRLVPSRLIDGVERIMADVTTDNQVIIRILLKNPEFRKTFENLPAEEAKFVLDLKW